MAVEMHLLLFMQFYTSLTYSIIKNGNETTIIIEHIFRFGTPILWRYFEARMKSTNTIAFSCGGRTPISSVGAEAYFN